MTTAIEKLSKHIKIDVDSMEPTVAKALPIKAWDMTSNQLLVNEQMSTPGNRDMLVRVVKDHQDEGWETILDYVTAELAAQVKPHIQGRVLAQTSPHNAYDADKIAAHARSYKKAYASVGITP
jgi:transaldolase